MNDIEFESYYNSDIENDLINCVIKEIVEKKEESLEEKFNKERIEWTEKIADISSKMKNLMQIAELMTTLYTERQRASEYYHYLISLLIGINKEYRAKYAERFDYYTNKAQVRYPNESSKDNRIKVDLAPYLERREILENHSKYILNTMGVMDNIIYAIPKRIEIEQISRGK